MFLCDHRCGLSRRLLHLWVHVLLLWMDSSFSSVIMSQFSFCGSPIIRMLVYWMDPLIFLPVFLFHLFFFIVVLLSRKFSQDYVSILLLECLYISSHFNMKRYFGCESPSFSCKLSSLSSLIVLKIPGFSIFFYNFYSLQVSQFVFCLVSSFFFFLILGVILICLKILGPQKLNSRFPASKILLL